MIDETVTTSASVFSRIYDIPSFKAVRFGPIAVAGLAYLILAVCMSPAAAVTLVEVEATCPIDGKKISAYAFGSLTVAGRRLDTRLVVLGAPSLLAPPICPDTGFPVYRQDFTEQEIDMIREFVATDKFREERASNTDHYIAAIIAERLGANSFDVAELYLIASWEAEGDEVLPRQRVLNPFDPQFSLRELGEFIAEWWQGETEVQRQTRRYMKLSLAKFDEFLSGNADQDEQWWKAVLISANLERRLGRFTEALNRLRGMSRDSLPMDSWLRQALDQLATHAFHENSAPQKLIDNKAPLTFINR